MGFDKFGFETLTENLTVCAKQKLEKFMEPETEFLSTINKYESLLKNQNF